MWINLMIATMSFLAQGSVGLCRPTCKQGVKYTPIQASTLQRILRLSNGWRRLRVDLKHGDFGRTTEKFRAFAPFLSRAAEMVFGCAHSFDVHGAS